MVKKLKRWPNQLWHSLENLFKTQQTNQSVFRWRFWLGILVTVLVVLYIELGRRASIVVPVPFLILLASVVLAANLAGPLAALISAAIAVTFIIYSATISFGPPTLTGGPVQVMLGALLYFIAAYFLGRTKSQNWSLIRQLQTYQESLENLVEARTSELNQANQVLELEVTERKQAEEELRESEARYRAIVEIQTEFVARTTPDGTLTFVNEAYCRQFGQPREQLLGTNFMTFLVEEDRQTFREKFAALTPENPIVTNEHREYRPDGSIIWYRWTDRGIFDEKGQLIEIQSVGRDITKRKQAEAARRRSEERFSTAFHLNPSAITITTLEEGRYLDVNKSFLKIHGYRREEVVGRTSAELNLWVKAADRVRIVQALRKDGRIQNMEVPFRIKSGEIRLALTSLEIIELDQEPCILSMFLDITERKQLEEQFRQVQKMEAIGQLTAGIAHDFNNRLLVINGLAELMRLDQTLNDSHQASLKQIIQSGQQSTDLVGQLLAFSRRQIIEPRVLNLNSIVIEMDKMLRPAVGEGIELEIILDPEPWLVKVDPTQIEQSILNLVINARDAMPKGGRLTIETARVVLDDDYPTHHLESQPGEHVLLAVSDTGHGMSEEIKSRIFDPFFTTKEQGKGTGLGLASVYGIVKQSGGNIWVYSEEGVGTTFKIYLPREKGPISVVTPHIEPEVKTLFGTETILMVEDDVAVRHLIGEVLVAHGYTLLEAQDASEALQLATQHKSSIHLLLTDVIMLGMSGKVLAEELVRIRSGLKVLFMSGYTDNAIMNYGILDSDINLLQKPFSPLVLTHKIREVLDS